jgi:toxin-antitoxin system PIN domain toxin
MRLLDVNVLVHAHRVDAQAHTACRTLLDDAPLGAEFAFTMSVVTGFLRIVTHPDLLRPPTALPVALATVAEWAGRPNARWLAPGPRHWRVFSELCQTYRAQGGAFYDLHLAALAIEHDAELVSLDQGFARIRELRWRPPGGVAG